jgi:hypothetical protein
MNPEHKTILDDIRISADMLKHTVEGIPADLMDRRPGPDEWSVSEILVHMRNVVMLLYGLRLRQLLYEEEATFANYEEDYHLLSASRPQLPAAEIMEMILIDHQQTVRLLSTLPEEAWQREGRHPEYGLMSVEFLARRIALHATEHVQQIVDTYNALM